MSYYPPTFYLFKRIIRGEEEERRDESKRLEQSPSLGHTLYNGGEKPLKSMSYMPPEVISHIGGFLDLQSRANFAASSTQQRQGIERFEEMVNLSVGRFLYNINYNYNVVYSNYLDKVERGKQYKEYSDNSIISRVFIDCLIYVYDSLGIPRDHIIERCIGLYIISQVNIQDQGIQFAPNYRLEFEHIYYDFYVEADIMKGAFFVYRLENMNTTVAFSRYLPMLLNIFETIISRMGFRMIYTSRYVKEKFSK